MISIVIPTFKNKVMLLQNLRQNMKFLKRCEIIIVNDDPTGNLKNDLKDFDQIILIENTINAGFGQAVNLGVKKAKNNFVMLLNDDVVLIDDSFLGALQRFRKDKNLFAVSFAQREKNDVLVGKNRVLWKKGIFFHEKADTSKEGYTAWAEGGACIVDRKKFLDLNGFDPLYSPFYWEDIDLSFRAWKSGHHIYFDSRVEVKHHHESTISKYFSKGFIEQVGYRNQFIFIWKNISDSSLLFSHLLLLPFNLLYYALVMGEKEFLKGFFEALKRLGKVVEERKKNQFKLSDREVFQHFI